MKFALNRQQKQAVIAEGNLLVIAVPGSGKTRVLTERAVHLINYRRQEHIVAVTFTREAAKEFKARIVAHDPNVAKQVTIGTFHSLAREQLLKTSSIKRKLINGVTQFNIIRQVWQHAAKGYNLEEVKQAIEHHKSQLTPRTDQPDTLPFYHAYQEMLERNHAMDFQDLLLLAVKGLRENSIAPVAGATLLVDEFQDTDSVQYAWIQEHGKTMDITVVGDDDQTIYSWRHAMGYRGMTEYERTFKAKRIHLEINYRSRPEILAIADKLIQHNQSRLRKELRGNKHSGGHVYAFSYGSYVDEAFAVIDRLHQSPHNSAVLSRLNRRLDLIEKTLTSYDIPYYRIGGKRLWERRHVGILLDLLKSLDDGSNVGIEHALAYAGLQENEIAGIYSALHNQLNRISKENFNHKQVAMTGDHRRVFNSFRQAYSTWERQYAANNIAMLIYAVTEWLARQSSSNPQKEDIEMAGDSLAQMRGTLNTRLNKVNNLSKKKRQEGIALMTLHGAKGLEFERVWIIGVEENILPHSDGELEEERRLCYVGVTRAMDTLYLSAVTEVNTVSRFIDEMGLIPEKTASLLEQTQTPAFCSSTNTK